MSGSRRSRKARKKPKLAAGTIAAAARARRYQKASSATSRRKVASCHTNRVKLSRAKLSQARMRRRRITIAMPAAKVMKAANSAVWAWRFMLRLYGGRVPGGKD